MMLSLSCVRTGGRRRENEELEGARRLDVILFVTVVFIGFFLPACATAR